MEAVEVIEKCLSEDELDIPDNIIHIVFPHSPPLNDYKANCNPLFEGCNKLIFTEQCNKQTVQDKNIFMPNAKAPMYNQNRDLPCIQEEYNSYKIKVSTKNSSSRNSESGLIKKDQSQSLFTQNNFHHCKRRLIQKDAFTQTDYSSNLRNSHSLNLFFCTFHSNEEAETYCNILSASAKNITSQETENGGKQPSLGSMFACTLDHDTGAALALDHRKHRRRKTKPKVIEDEDSIWEECEDNPADSKESSSKSLFVEKGYALRTQRLSTRHGDTLYLLDASSQGKKRSKAGMALRCCHCPEVFPTFRRLEKHTRAAHDSEKFSFPCDLCGATFTRPHNLDRHKETRHRLGEKRFLCELCGRRFNRRDILAAHTNIIHSKVFPKPRKMDGKCRQQVYRCAACNKHFSRPQNFSKHQKGNLNCPECLQAFACKTHLLKHVYKQHAAVCNICEKVCANKQQLYFHKLSHTPKYNCKYCSKGFNFEPQFIIHLATHTGNKPLRCQTCNKSFAHKNAINKHIWQEHTDANKRFPCKFCSKTFVYKAKLDSHLRSHTGEKPFACLLCPSSFSHNCNLAAHLRSVHAKDKRTASASRGKRKGKKARSSTPTPQEVAAVGLQPQCQGKAPVPKKVVPIAPRLGSSDPLSEALGAGGGVYRIVYTIPTQAQ